MQNNHKDTLTDCNKTQNDKQQLEGEAERLQRCV